MFCGSPDGRGVRGRLDTRICMAESLQCSPEKNTTLLIVYIPIHNKRFKYLKKKTPPSNFQLQQFLGKTK